MKVLYLNCNYFTGIRGGWKNYLTYGYRYLFLRDKVREKNIASLQKILQVAQPDIVCLTEIRIKELKYFKKNFKYIFDTCKYEGTKWGKLPGFRRNRMAILSHEPVKAEIGAFEQGMKRAFLKFSGDWGQGHFVHLSLGRRVRKTQIQQLQEYIHDRAFFVGDFNTLSREEQGICPIYQNKVFQKHSFPAISAKITLDHCIGKVCQDIQYFDSQISDHLGMIFHLPVAQTVTA